MYDTILTGGRIVDPSQDLDTATDIAFADGKVAALGADIDGTAKQTIDASGKIVSPGLIDIHAHVNWGATYLSVEAETVAKNSGTTTFVDAGSAGAGTFHGFRKHVIEPSPLRIVAFLNISHPGMFGYGPGFMVGESADLKFLHTGACVDVARQHGDLICGVKVRLGGNVSGTLGTIPLDLAIDAAEELNLPVMVHIGPTPPRRQDILERLRPGDILTHCCRMFPNALVDRERNIRAEVEDARKRGIIFDVGHGRGSFDFNVARGMIDSGFVPDVISSDVHIVSINGPAFDVLVTMSKFLCLGVPLSEVIRAVTVNAAHAIGRPELGSLRPGSPGDATVLSIETGAFDYYDSLGQVLTGEQKFAVEHILVGGTPWP
ncbi:MAG: amidohydrolase/deacetylase family metallohydrolase [Alphaproteobacteria bacterium]|nr:amidohydrolase/deacetylase family metallohydrolase [Alphaproteobacteria bacterium]